MPKQHRGPYSLFLPENMVCQNSVSPRLPEVESVGTVALAMRGRVRNIGMIKNDKSSAGIIATIKVLQYFLAVPDDLKFPFRLSPIRFNTQKRNKVIWV